MLKKFGPYLVLIALAFGFSVLVSNVEALKHAFTTPPEGLYLVIALLSALGYGLNLIAPKTVFPWVARHLGIVETAIDLFY